MNVEANTSRHKAMKRQQFTVDDIVLLISCFSVKFCSALMLSIVYHKYSHANFTGEKFLAIFTKKKDFWQLYNLVSFYHSEIKWTEYLDQ